MAQTTINEGASTIQLDRNLALRITRTEGTFSARLVYCGIELSHVVTNPADVSKMIADFRREEAGRSYRLLRAVMAS